MKEINYMCVNCDNNGTKECDRCDKFIAGDDTYKPTGWSRKDDMVNHPAHYISENGIEVIDVIEAFTSDLMGIEATDTGNIIKYICRWKHKNGIEDLKKAQWYLNHLINIVEKEND